MSLLDAILSQGAEPESSQVPLAGGSGDDVSATETTLQVSCQEKSDAVAEAKTESRCLLHSTLAPCGICMYLAEQPPVEAEAPARTRFFTKPHHVVCRCGECMPFVAADDHPPPPPARASHPLVDERTAANVAAAAAALPREAFARGRIAGLREALAIIERAPSYYDWAKPALDDIRDLIAKGEP